MSQLLSACRHSDDFDARKSRRSLFISAKTALEDAPEPKRRRSADDVSLIKQESDGGFIHSSTSPFKSIQGENKGLSLGSPKQASPRGKCDQPSPEQKILLERQKQQKLLEEQRGFDSQDERWKRIEHELEKAFPKAGPSRPMMVHQSSSPLPYDALVEQSSVAIQASLIDDLSPLKPLSYYRKVKSPWKNSESLQSSSSASATPSPVPFQNGSALNSFNNVHAMSPVPILPATERPSNVSNVCPSNSFFFQIPASAGNGASLVWATPTPPSGSSTPSPDQLIKMAVGQPANTPMLYSPRSLTPTPEPAHSDTSLHQSILATPSLVAMGESQVSPVQQALSVQVPTMLNVGHTEMYPVTPISGNMTSLPFTTPLVKVTDVSNVVSMETPTSTAQLLTDVSKRLSLPFPGLQSI